MFRSRSPMVRKTDKMTSFMTVLSRYVLFSSIFWVLFSLACFVLLYNPNYGEKSKLTLLSSWHLLTFSLMVIAGILIFSAFLGAVISIPAILLKILMKIRVDKKSLKGQKPIILIYLSIYVPILLCISSNLIVLLISTSSAPQQIRHWIDPNFKLYKIQNKIYSNIFEIKRNNLYKTWRNSTKELNKNSKFIFLIPQNLLLYKDLFSETKKILEKENQWLLYLPTKESIAASILNTTYFSDERLYLPAPIQNNEDKNPVQTNSELNFIGINGRNLLNFNSIFQKDNLGSNINNTWFNIFLNRFALSQPQIYLFFRLGFISSIFNTWHWENLINSDNYLLFSYGMKIGNLTSKKENFLLFLTELEGKKVSNFFNAIDWPENISKEEFEKILKEIDLNLSIAIKGLKDSGIENIVVAPYKQGNSNLESSLGFSNFDFKDQLMNTEILHKELFNSYSTANCHPLLINFNLNSNKNSTKVVNSFLLDTINPKNDPYPTIKSEFTLAIKEEMRHGVICQTPKKSTYITISKENYLAKDKIALRTGYKNIYQQIFKEQEKKNKKSEKDDINNYKSIKSEINIADFLKQFDIFKINMDPYLNYALVTDIEKEQFIKVYGNEVKDNFQSYIQYFTK
ncbi:hypothetical protein QEJ31_11215 [Pigmentibacter sp. JX0631]|uniref:hypothetical protein n=1 Tax=Pigmentibacter sp. JX0631 TaxID=2976982 RepID=UPI002468942E|nr:hypothetical protein [Pigmentibacter sp. JX0631]WGL59089.1 hypothetical protein QEJ31_11215 [Pigmentibacter sp. JX0631]